MGNGIYNDMSGLRPRRRRAWRRGRRRAEPVAAPPDEESMSVPVPLDPPEPDYQPKVVGPMARRDWDGESRLEKSLQANLDHLRSRSSIQRPPSAPPANPRPPVKQVPDNTQAVSTHSPPPPVPVGEEAVTEPFEPEPPSPPGNQRIAKQQVRRWNKALRKAERTQHRQARAAARERRRRPPDPSAIPGLELNSTPAPSRSDRASMNRRERREAARAARTEARANYEKAKEAIEMTRRVGAAQIAEAKGRARNKEHLASVVPAGEWNRRELRRHVTTARRQAKADAAELTTSHSLALSKMRAQAREYRRQSRRWHRTPKSNPVASLADSRILTIRAGLIACWIGLAGFTWLAWDSRDLEQPELYWLLAGLAGGLLVFSTVPWRRIAERPSMSVFAGLWLVLLMIAMVTLAEHHESGLALFTGSAWIILFAAVLLPQLVFAGAALATIGTYYLAVEISVFDLPTNEVVLRLAALAATAVIVGLTAHELRKQAVVTLRQLRKLDSQREALGRREAELLQLYEVSRTIGAGELREVLPELVARTAGYIGAKVGLVILHRPEEQALVALSPLWVAGQSLEAEGYRFNPTGDSTAALVFSSGERYLRNALSESDIGRDQLLADLGVERVAAVPLRVEGETIGVLLVADKPTDFTERDMAALELLSTPAGLVLNHLARYEDAQETGRRMKEVAQLKSDFVSVVSHELRTPLTSVIGALSTLARPELVPDNPVAQSLLDSASTQAQRLKTLIEDLLTVSKIDNQALPIRLEVVDLGLLIGRLVQRVPAWSGHVDLEISPRLPAAAVDPDHFERVMTNLLDNARKYASESRILITARAVDEEVWVSVIDHGEGIPYEYEETIFERFTQIERPDTRFKGGTGLGLNIVKDLTEAMQGRVWLEATPGSGATFTLAFPRADANTEAGLQVGEGLLLVDPSRDRVEAPINMDDLAGGGEGPVAE